MPHLEKEEALALFERGNRSVELVRDWSPGRARRPDCLHQLERPGHRRGEGRVTHLYEQRRLEEANRTRVRRVWGLAVAAAVAAVLIFVLWEEYG